MSREEELAIQYCRDMNYIQSNDKKRSLEAQTAIDAYIKGFRQARICDKKSPLTGGDMFLKQELSKVTFRGVEVEFVKKFYHCVESGQDFTDTELDDDNMWAIFRAYCEKLGYNSFKDMVLITDIVPVWDAGLSWKDIERIITIENDMIAQYDRAMLDQMPDEDYYKEILRRFNEQGNV